MSLVRIPPGTRFALLALLAGGALRPAAADEPPAVRFADPPALAALVDEAMRANPSLVAAVEMSHAAGRRVDPAATLPDPLVELEYQAMPGYTSLGSSMDTRLGIFATQMLPTAGKLGHARARTEAEALAAASDPERMRRMVTGELRRAAVMAAVARAAIASLDEQQSTWAAAEEAARTAYETGAGSQGELVRAQAERARLFEMRQREEADEAAALAMIRGLLGRPDGEVALPTLAELAATLPATPLADPGPDEENPWLAGARAAATAADAAAALARAERTPDLELRAGWMERGSLDDMFLVGIGARLPVFGKSRQEPMVAEAEAMGRAAAARFSETRLAVTTNRARNLALLGAALGRAAALETSILVRDRLVLDSAKSAWQTGRAPLAEVFMAAGMLLEDTRASLSATGRALWHLANLVEGGPTSPAVPWP